MPRPQRVKIREQARAGTTDTAEDADRPQELALDSLSEPEQVTRQGLVSEGELDLSRQVARRLGWVPQEEWKRDPSKWTDAPEFLDNTPAEITSLKERLRRSGQVAEEIAENARREAKAQAEAELREAARTGDEEKAVQAADKVARNSGPHPQTQAWLGRNPWFNEDPEAQAVAVAAITRATKAGESIEAQLQAGEAAVRRRYPEHFGAASPSETRQTETRLSDIRPAAPAVTGGSRGTGLRTPTKEKGWMDIPQTERSQMQRFVTSAMRKGQTEAQATSFLATAYWREKA
jgi:hypothetical protein